MYGQTGPTITERTKAATERATDTASDLASSVAQRTKEGGHATKEATQNIVERGGGIMSVGGKSSVSNTSESSGGGSGGGLLGRAKGILGFGGHSSSHSSQAVEQVTSARVAQVNSSEAASEEVCFLASA